MTREEGSDTAYRSEELEVNFHTGSMDMIRMCAGHRYVVMAWLSFNERVYERTNIVRPVSVLLEILSVTMQALNVGGKAKAIFPTRTLMWTYHIFCEIEDVEINNMETHRQWKFKTMFVPFKKSNNKTTTFCFGVQIAITNRLNRGRLQGCE